MNHQQYTNWLEYKNGDLFTNYEQHARWHEQRAYARINNERASEWHAQQAEQYYLLAKFHRNHNR